MIRKISIFAAILCAAQGCAATGAGDAVPASAPAVAAPDIPDTEIFVGRLTIGPSGPGVSELNNATSRDGYDNQPSFLPGKAQFYYVAEGESGKTDIRLYDIGRKASEPVFVSFDRSEYSPKEAPGGGISYIQENPAGDLTRVHRRALDGGDEGAAVADFAPLGYYVWLDGGAALGVYYRSEPGSLYRIEVASGETKLLQEKIGRALQADRAGAHLWFTQVIDEEAPAFRLARYSSESGAIETLFDLPAGAQDFAVFFDASGAPSGVLSASGPTLFWRSLASASQGWVEAANLASRAAANATRIAVSDDNRWIAVVAEPAR